MQGDNEMQLSEVFLNDLKLIRDEIQRTNHRIEGLIGCIEKLLAKEQDDEHSRTKTG